MKTDKKWIILGPGGGGTVLHPAVSPHNPDVVLACCDMTGCYITKDGGESWREFNLRIRVDTFAFDPMDPDVMYAGSTGLFRSADGGETWSLILPRPENVLEEIMVGDEADNAYIAKDGSWPAVHPDALQEPKSNRRYKAGNRKSAKIQAVQVDPEQSGHIYAAFNPNAQLVSYSEDKEPNRLYIYHSTDSGNSWNQIEGVTGGRVDRFFIDPASPKDNRFIYIFTDECIYTGHVKGVMERLPYPDGITYTMCSSWGMNPETGRPLFFLTARSKWADGKFHTGVWRSDDCGRSWKELHNGLCSNIAGPESEKLPLYKLIAPCEQNAKVVYLSVRGYPESCNNQVLAYAGLFKSRDGGETWEWIINGRDETITQDNRDGWYIRQCKLNKVLDPHIYASPAGLGISPVNPDVCYGSDSEGIYRTVNGGRSWEQLYCNIYEDGSARSRGIDVTTTYGVHFDPFDKNHIVVSYTDIGLFQSFNGGESWLHSCEGVPVDWTNTCYWVEFDPEIKGKAWSVWSLAHDFPREKMFLNGGNFDDYAGGVCRSEDGIKTWTVSSKGMPVNCVSNHIILDPGSPAGNRTLYVAACGNGVFKSTDDGHSWTLKNTGLGENLFAWRFTLLPDGTLFLVLSRGMKDGKPLDGCIYKSNNGAESWQKVATPEGVNAPNDLVYDPENPQRMYLACWPRTLNGKEENGGAYITEDGGCSWRNIFNKTAHVYALSVEESNSSVVYMVTFDSRAYRSEDRGNTWKPLGGYNFKWGHRVVPDPYNKDMIYITTYGSSVWYGPAKGVEGAFEDIYPY